LAASAFSADIAEKDRVSWVIEIDTEVVALELLLVALDDELGALLLLLLLLLQAAAPRHKASDTDATAAPFVVTRIINTTLRLKGRAASRHARVPRRRTGLRDLSVSTRP